jgi:uncharacterized protein (DUF58 family)
VPALKVVLLLLAALAFGQATDWKVADHLALALLALLLGSWLWSRFSLRGVAVRRHAPSDRAQVGQPLREEVEVRNPGRFAKLWLELVDYSTLPNHAVSRAVHVRGRGRVRWQTETRCVRRGRFRLGPLVLRAGDPLGLFPSRRVLPEAREVLVYPATVDLRGFAPPSGTLVGGNAIDRRNPFVTPSVSGIRDYAPGDAFNRISWAATARLGRLMVKEFDLDPTADVWIVLDLEQRVHVAATRPLTFAADARGEWPVEAWLDSTEEYAVTIVASLARRFLDQGRNVGLIATGAHHEVIPADRTPRQAQKVLEALAVVHADGHLPLAEALLAEGRRFSRRSSLLVVTPSTEEGWVSALAEIAARGVRGAAVLVEPETFGPAGSSLLVVSDLLAAGVPTHLVKYGEEIAAALSAPQASLGLGRAVRG